MRFGILPSVSGAAGLPYWRCCTALSAVSQCCSIGEAPPCRRRNAISAEAFYPALQRPIASASYRTRSVRPMRSVVVDLMPLRRQMFFTVVP